MKSRYPHNDQVKALLKDKADYIQREGLNYLLPKWQQVATTYSTRESSIYEWLNDMDARRIIDEILAVLPPAEKVKTEQDLSVMDSQVIKNTFEVNECIWGQQEETAHRYNRQKNWYYYRINQAVFELEKERFTKK